MAHHLPYIFGVFAEKLLLLPEMLHIRDFLVHIHHDKEHILSQIKLRFEFFEQFHIRGEDTVLNLLSQISSVGQ